MVRLDGRPMMENAIMKVKLEECYSGHDNFNVRVTLPDGGRYIVPLEGMKFPSRKLSSAVLDLLETVEGIPRKRVRFT